MLAHTHSYLGTWAHSLTPVHTQETLRAETHTQEMHTHTQAHTQTHRNIQKHTQLFHLSSQYAIQTKEDTKT